MDNDERYSKMPDRNLLLCKDCSSRTFGYLIDASEKTDHDAWHEAHPAT